MTVKELIEMLQTLPQENIVIYTYNDTARQVTKSELVMYSLETGDYSSYDPQRFKEIFDDAVQAVHLD